VNFSERLEKLVAEGKLNMQQARDMKDAMGAIPRAHEIKRRRTASPAVIMAAMGLALLLVLAGGFIVSGSAGSKVSGDVIQTVSETMNQPGATGQGNAALSAYLLLVFCVFLPLLALTGLTLMSWNGIIQLDEQAASSQAVLQAALQRRHDLLGNLFDTMKELMSFEKDIQNAASSGKKDFFEDLEAEVAKGGVSPQPFSPRLAALVQNYPDIKSAANMQNIQEELAVSENRVYAAREYFNVSVRDYNAAIRRFPGILLAGLADLPAREYLEIESPDACPVSFKEGIAA